MSHHDQTPAIQSIIEAVLNASDPCRLVAEALDGLLDQGLRQGHTSDQPCRFDILATGKAADTMLAGACNHRAFLIERVLCITTPQRTEPAHACPNHASQYTRLIVDHPIATERNLFAARQVKDFVSSAHPDVHLIYLLSGGTSAALTLPREPVTLADLSQMTGLLIQAGASITELNTVRKHLEVLKGGGLASLSSHAHIHGLLLSDVIGDDVSVIGSGPIATDTTTPTDAINILRKYGVLSWNVPSSNMQNRILTVLRTEHPSRSDIESTGTNTIIANNATAIDAAGRAAQAMGRAIVSVTHSVTTSSAQAGVGLAREAVAVARRVSGPSCIIQGGETTVNASKASGIGGPCQELALAAAIELEDRQPACPITIAAFATDGIDGPTPAAGAIINTHTCSQLRQRHIDPHKALANHDSYAALNAINACIHTGPTGTNLNDIMIALIDMA